MAQTVKNLPAMQETWLPSLGQEGPLEKGMATHSNILAWRISRTEEPDRLQSMGSQIDRSEQLLLSLFLCEEPEAVGETPDSRFRAIGARRELGMSCRA